MIYLDTHVLIWLYDNKLDLVPASVQKCLENNEILISPIVLLELEYLFDIDRIRTRPRKITDFLEKMIGLNFCGLDFKAVIFQSMSESWTRDPFDRMITSQAKIKKRVLITKDSHIRNNYAKAYWGD